MSRYLKTKAMAVLDKLMETVKKNIQNDMYNNIAMVKEDIEKVKE